MKFQCMQVKSIKADIAAGEMTIAFVGVLNEETLDMAEQLKAFANKDGPAVSLDVHRYQPPLPMFDQGHQLHQLPKKEVVADPKTGEVQE